jgi:predicted secreted hydrolase
MKKAPTIPIAIAALVLACCATSDVTSDVTQESDTINFCANDTLPPTAIQLPHDDAPKNPNAMNEWFWFGQLDGRYTYHVFLFQFTVPNFICPGMCTDPSGFTTLLWGSVGLTDKQANVFHQSSYLIPGTFQQTVDSFNLAIDHGPSATGGGGVIDHVKAVTDGYQLDLYSTNLKTPLIEFNGGHANFVTPSGQFAGDNWYYSRTRMGTVGSLTTPGGNKTPVVGQSWFDREWDPCCFAGVAVQWDWYGVQLDDGQELMVYDIFVAGHRDQIMSRTVNFSGRAPGCDQGVLDASQFTLGHAGAWTSPHSGITYPTSFTVDIPSRGLHLTVHPTVQDQELTAIPAFFTPWYEGSMIVDGTKNGAPIHGVGQAELFGYSP